MSNGKVKVCEGMKDLEGSDGKLSRHSFLRDAGSMAIASVIGAPIVAAMLRKMRVNALVNEMAYASGEQVKPVKLSFEPTGDTCPGS